MRRIDVVEENVVQWKIVSFIGHVHDNRIIINGKKFFESIFLIDNKVSRLIFVYKIYIIRIQPKLEVYGKNKQKQRRTATESTTHRSHRSNYRHVTEHP